MDDHGLMLITSHGNWNRLAKEKVWVFDRVRPWMEPLTGRRAIVYLTAHGGISSLGGLVQFRSEIRPVENDAGFSRIYPFQAAIEVVAALRSPLDIYEIKDRLSFFPKGSNWGGVLQGQPLKRIPRDDFHLMEAEVLSRV